LKTNRLSKKLSAALNVQMTKEAHASQIYLSYAAWADNQGLRGTANFLFRHAQEERNHMMKILEYILKRGAEVHITAIPVPHETPASINSCFEKIFEHEVDNTKAVYTLVKISLDEQIWKKEEYLVTKIWVR
jgi:ferritin